MVIFFARFLFELGNIVVILLTLWGIVGSNLSPEFGNRTYFVSLILPFLFLLNVFLIILKFASKRRVTILLVFQIVLVLILGRELFTINFEKDYKGNKDVTLFSYNVHGFNAYSKDHNSMHGIIKEVSDINPDIVCLQEYLAYSDTTKLNFENDIKDLYPYSYISTTENRFNISNGLAMFSKYPIAKTDSIFFAGNALAQIVDILVEEDTLRIVNIHLQTTYLSKAILFAIVSEKIKPSCITVPVLSLHNLGLISLRSHVPTLILPFKGK